MHTNLCNRAFAGSGRIITENASIFAANVVGKLKYDCTQCVGYCCSIYERVDVRKRDIRRLAKHFGLEYEQAERRFITTIDGHQVLKRKADLIFERTCIFLDQTTRLCSIYEARPGTCREWPTHSGDRCVYFDILQFERRQQDDPDFVPVVEIRVLVDADQPSEPEEEG
jgi:Fe-S-cluster containining protein